MTIYKGKTIEGFITVWLTVFTVIFLLLSFLLLWQLNLNIWQISLAISFITLVCIIAIVRFRSYVILIFNRALLHIDAIRQEDYKQYAKPFFTQGIVGKFHQQLKDFSEELAEKKQRYDQHAFLIYQLIDQLDTPVLVFNEKEQLTYANDAFSKLYEGQIWQRYRHASSRLLGLNKTEKGWQLQGKSQQKQQKWQISQSVFIDAGVAHQLLVFTNIELALRQSQVNAWQQIISVMGHEIRNSLTPVATIAESLSERSESSRDKEALTLISERCLHLQDFINRYASVSRQVNLNYQQIATEQLASKLQDLFTDTTLKFQIVSKLIWADKFMLEQVLINLIKNALEADANQVIVELNQDKQQSIIKIIDNGHGFANLDNLFVPLFTTKPEGQGIGLNFCRNIIEQHGGNISLKNNRDAGVTVTMSLPLST